MNMLKRLSNWYFNELKITETGIWIAVVLCFIVMGIGGALR